MATALGLVPVAKVSEPLLRVAARGPLELVGEDAAACGDMHEVAGIERPPQPAGDIAEALPVQSGRGGARAGQPVEHEVVELAVAGEMTPRIAPSAHLLHDPRGKTGRRVDERVADRLRACRCCSE